MNIIGIAGRRTADQSTAGSGKDEVAKVLVRKHGYVAVSFADEIKRTAMRWYDFSIDQLWGDKKEEPDYRYPREHGPWTLVSDAEEGAVVCACCGYRATNEVWEQPDGTPRYAPLPGNHPPCFLVPRYVLRYSGSETGRMFFFDTWVNIVMRAAHDILVRGCLYHPVTGVGLLVVNNGYKGVVIPDVRWPAANEGEAVKRVGGRLWLVERPGTSQTGTAVAKHQSETQPIPDECFDRILYNDSTLEALEQKVDTAIIPEGGKKEE